MSKLNQNGAPDTRTTLGTTAATATTAALMLVSMSPQTAHADVKIVSEVTISGIAANGGQQGRPGGQGGPNGQMRRNNNANGQQGGGPGDGQGGGQQDGNNPQGRGGFGGPGGPGGPGGGGQGRGGFGGGPGGGSPLLVGLQNGKQTVTTYFKGSKARRETTGGAVVIYDKSADKIYTLDTKAKTYSVLSFADTLNRGANLPEPMQQFMSQKAAFSLKTPTSDTAASAAVSGRSTQSYSIAGSLSMERKAGAGMNGPNGGGPGGQGGFPGGGGGPGGQGGPPPGGFPGGGGQNGQNNFNGGQTGGGGRQFGGMRGGPGGGGPRVTSLSGDLWVGRAAEVFTPESGVQNTKDLSLALADQVLPSGNPLFKPFAERLTGKNQIPLKSRLVIELPAPPQPPPPPGGGNDNQGPPPPQGEGDPNGPPPPQQNGDGQQPRPAPSPVTITMEVKSIATDVTLADDTFTVPSDYKEVAPPAPPAFGGPGGGGPGGGRGFGGPGGGGRGGFPGGPPPGGEGGPPPPPPGEEAPPPPDPNNPAPAEPPMA